MTTFPTLYKLTATGATQSWNIRVEGSTIIKTYGQVGGAMQEARDTITVGKNIGKSNETTPEQQAELEAKSQWEKKLKDKNYHVDVNAAEAGESSDVVEGGILPMLAHSFAKQGHKIKYPACVQPKLDGHRCVAVVEAMPCDDCESSGIAGGPDGYYADKGKPCPTCQGATTVTLWSRTRKVITGVPHVAEAVAALNLPNGTVLDGELYNHDYREKFEELTSFIRQATPKPGYEVVQYHVYDVAASGPFWERSNFLTSHLTDDGTIVVVPTMEVQDAGELTESFGLFTAAGYEGAMVRNSDSPYVNKRSYDLQKIKEFADDEFKIVDVVEGRGRMAGRGIFVCKSYDGDPFRVKMAGSLDNLTEYLNDKEKFIGRTLTVQFQGLTSDSIPRFPIGLRFREDL